LPEKVKFIIETLETHGYEAYAVGGCVRDTMLHRTPGDWDITTQAKPEQVKEIFAEKNIHTIDTGIQHGTVTVMVEHEGFEVTTYRIDGEYEDARHPKNVQFTASLLEDLKRRDFTINAMAYNDKNGLIDAFDGVGDLERGVIRCVGCAMERFSEDALRMLRAVRFAAQLGFSNASIRPFLSLYAMALIVKSRLFKSSNRLAVNCTFFGCLASSYSPHAGETGAGQRNICRKEHSYH